MTKRIIEDPEKERRPRGRPTRYKPEYCEVAEKLGKEGCSPAEIAAELDVARETLLDWAQQYPEFSTSMKKAKTFEQQWWERIGKKGMIEGKINAAVWTKSMQARFRHDYTERTEVTGAGGGAIKHETTNILDVSQLDVEELEVLETALINSLGQSDGAD
jgi:transposase